MRKKQEKVNKTEFRKFKKAKFKKYIIENKQK